MKAITTLASAVLAILPLLTQAQLTNWAVNVGGNGHYYEPIRSPGGITWSDASLIASNRGGYLATITSSNENAFVFGLVRQDTSFWYHSPFNTWWGPWLGGVQPAGSPEPAGAWQWLTGEPVTYSNWSPGQPNNSNGNENRIQFGGKTSIAGTWNDLSETNTTYVRSFIIEYSPGQPNPIQFGRQNSVVSTWNDLSATNTIYVRSFITEYSGPVLSIRVSKEVEVCWDTRTNWTYQVQSCSELTTNCWADLGAPIEGSGTQSCIYDAMIPGQPQRFYRVITFPR
jgi:Lectin C-type domain